MLLWLLTACAPDGDADLSTAPDFCAGATAHRWDPGDDSDLLQFPDDALTVDDETSPTGLRLALDPDETPWMQALPDLLRPIARGIDRRSGFGRMGGVVLRFSADLGAVPDLADLRLVDLSAAVPVDVPYTASLSDWGRQLVLQPLRPMQAGTAHAVVLTRDHSAADGGCVAPADSLQSALAGVSVDAVVDRVADRYAALPGQLGIDAADISAATVFTTHDDLAAIRAVADELSAVEGRWSEAPVCVPWQGGRHCAGRFVARDHRGVEDVIVAEAAGEWELDVDIYLPEGDGPFPVVLFGHGINSSRGEGGGAARRLGPELGVAVVAVDAVEHGDHPVNADGELDALSFLGMTLAPPSMDGLLLSQNFVQTNLDRHQLIALLTQQPDVDGDGSADLDMGTLGYLGISLGGLMGPGQLALSDDIAAAVLPVAGAHLTTFAMENEFVVDLQEFFADLVGGEAEWQRALAVGQANLDPADPAVFAAHVLSDRFEAGSAAPDVLVPVCAFDGTVPVTAGQFIARALDVPHVPPVYEPVDDLPVSSVAPLAGNQGGVTAGFFQLDRVTRSGAIEVASHANTPWSEEGTLLTRHFFATWLEDGTAEIVDPYATLGTPPLEE